MKNVLLVYEYINGELEFYLIPESKLTDEEQVVLDQAQGRYVNGTFGEHEKDSKEAVLLVMYAVAKSAEEVADIPAKDKCWAQLFVEYKIECGTLPPNKTITKLVHTGFIL